nr:ABC transporter ATP-binding protein [Fervidobacterium pennivorans]
MIKFENISHQFKDKKALENINGIIDDGEVVAIIGENGSGKSTLLNVVATFIKPSSGKLIYNDMNVFERKENIEKFRELISYVSEKSTFIPELTLRDNLLYFKSVFSSQRCIHDIAMHVKIDNLLDENPNKLSKGQKQRFALAISLLKDAKIILLDEPAEGLDIETKQIVKDLVKEFKEKSCIVFYVTHDEDELEEVCDKIIALKDGKIKFFGTVDEFWKTYEKFYSVTFEPPENPGKKLTRIMNIDELKIAQEKVRVLHIRNLGLREIINITENVDVEHEATQRR